MDDMAMEDKRYTDEETQKRYFRSDGRVFRMNSDWYVALREGELGPFVSQNEAARELAAFIQEQVHLKVIQEAREVEVLAGNVTPINKNVWDNRPDVPRDTVPRIDASKELFI